MAFGFGQQRGLVSLEAQQIVAALFDNLLGNMWWATQRGQAHQRPAQVKHGQQVGHGPPLAQFLALVLPGQLPGQLPEALATAETTRKVLPSTQRWAALSAGSTSCIQAMRHALKQAASNFSNTRRIVSAEDGP